jgi:putative endopeptidase
MRRMIIAATLAGLLAGCQQEPEQTSQTPQTSGGSGPATDAVAQARIGSWGVDLDNRDPNIRPGDDFFGYANGSWLKNYELPADKSSYGSFQALHEQSQERVKLLVEELAEADPQPGSIEQKIGDYYLSYLDTEAIDSAGLTPIAAQLQAIADVDSQLQLIELFGRVDLDGNQSPIEAGIDIDRMNPERWIVDVSVGGLGLPDRDYYLEDSARFSDIRAAYQAHIEKMLTLIGFDNAATAAQAVMALETSIAEVLWPRSQRRNRDLTYNLMSLEALQAAYPNFAWRGYFAANGVVPEEINLRYPSATGPVLDIIANTDLNTWKAYLSYHLLTRNAFALAQEIDDATFDFYGRVLRGQPEQQERWRRGVGLVSGRNGMGDAIGQVYVERYFPAANKAMMEDLVENLREGLRQRIAGLEWMSEDTKAYAFEKLQAFTPNIGYPSEWEDFSSVQIRADDLMGNVRAMREWQRADALERLTRPTDPAEWFMSPQTVNAYYVAQFNSITFPAGILEPPFFDPAADPAVNYGAIGAVIGHEMGHGFDDQGSKSDAEGVQRNWWSDEDRARFDARTAQLAAQYDAYEAVPGTFVDGEFTLGENIGDLGGLNVAYHAYRLSLNGKEPPVIDGLTGDQRFFLAFAQVWRGITREETLVARLKSDPHSPNRFRANGTVRNMDAWYEAFDVQPDDALYLPPDQRVSIW